MRKRLTVIDQGGAFSPLMPRQGILQEIRCNSLLNIVRAVPEKEAEDPGVLDRAVASMMNRTPEEVEAVRTRLFAEMEPPRPLPPGKTLEDVISGKWPGDETDKQILQALEKLS